MTELERRALLGDKTAQEECTDKGIVLLCPFCGAKKSKVRHACGDYFVECLKCHCTSSVTSTKETVIKDWNTRSAPPLGRCIDCANICEVGDNLVTCDIFERDMMPDDFCSQFEAKEGEHIGMDKR